MLVLCCKAPQSPTFVVQTCFLFLTQTAGRADSAALLGILCYLQCQMQVLPAFFHLWNDPFVHSKGRSAGLDEYITVYAFHMYTSTPTVQRHFICTHVHVFILFFLAFLQGLLIEFDVCTWEEKKQKDICVLSVPCQVCLAELFLDRVFFSRSASCDQRPTGNTAFLLCGSAPWEYGALHLYWDFPHFCHVMTTNFNIFYLIDQHRLARKWSGWQRIPCFQIFPTFKSKNVVCFCTQPFWLNVFRSHLQPFNGISAIFSHLQNSSSIVCFDGENLGRISFQALPEFQDWIGVWTLTGPT